jgi:hypothetical protein
MAAFQDAALYAPRLASSCASRPDETGRDAVKVTLRFERRTLI